MTGNKPNYFGELMRERLELRAERHRRQQRTRLDRYRPYPKQFAFHAAGAANRERLFMAGNRCGKTLSGAAEMAMHLSGRYPAWWEGKRFEKPIRAWAAGVTKESTRDVVQDKLIGPPQRSQDWGTGLIPYAALGDISMARGIADLIDTVSVRHASGAWSSLQLKSYEQGREKWQGTALEVVWFDEEPPGDIYIEGLTRTNETGGIVYLTFTPLNGMSAVVDAFMREYGGCSLDIDDGEKRLAAV
jgi:phage terminase large subunit-like protein